MKRWLPYGNFWAILVSRHVRQVPTRLHRKRVACRGQVGQSGAGGAISNWQSRALRLENWGPRVLASGDPQRHPDVLALARQHLS